MRDILVLALILGAAPVCLFSPFFGVLMWNWVAYFNPHRFTWFYAYSFPVAAAIAVPTLLGTIFGKKSFRAFQQRETMLLMILWAWTGLTFLHALNVPLFAGHVAEARVEIYRFSKILLMTFVMLVVVTTRQKLKTLLYVTAFSFGLLALKSSIFAIRTLGESKVGGPADSFLADNNAYALALNMMLPLFYYLARDEENRWLRRASQLFFLAGILSVIFSYSRGGLLGLAVVLAAICLKARWKVVGSFLLVATAFLTFTFAPQQWTARMDKFLSGNLDTSAKQRLIIWETAWNFAKDYPITGGGFVTLPDEHIFQRYQPEPLPGGFRSSGPHSIYVQFLADHGFIGLGVFLLFLLSCLASLRNLRRGARHLPSGEWLVNYSHMIEVSLLGYMVSGAFLGLGYFDLFYQIATMVIVMKCVYRRELLEISSDRQEEGAPEEEAQEVVPATATV